MGSRRDRMVTLSTPKKNRNPGKRFRSTNAHLLDSLQSMGQHTAVTSKYVASPLLVMSARGSVSADAASANKNSWALARLSPW